VEIEKRADPAFKGEDLHTSWHRALAVLQSLQTPLGVMASGQDDHFHAIFGRDSLWTVLFALEAGHLLRTSKRQEENIYAPSLVSYSDYHTWLHKLAVTVLSGLASLQGKVLNDVNEEQPGRIIHEYWDPVPQGMIMAGWPVINGRYYGAFDATFLYLSTLLQVVEFFDDGALLEELWSSAEAAFHWMLDWSDLDQDGLVEYAKRNPDGIGLAHQSWKDSGESIQQRDHQLIRYPVAWVEIQGYAWSAYAAFSRLAKKRECLDHSLHQEIQQRMVRIQEGLCHFWLDEEQFPAIVLDGEKKPIRTISSNPGHLLWSECLEQEQAELICKRLMLPDMLTPWGLRTLSDQAYYYNPLIYHCGAIWPFDNAVAAVGMYRYGFKTEAFSIAERVLQAMLAFDDPVELYTVQPAHWLRWPRIESEWFLAHYFNSCNVQAWTAAAIIYLTSLLLYG